MTFQECIQQLSLLTEASKQLMLAGFEVEELRKSQEIFRRGRPATDLYFIEAGVVREYIPPTFENEHPEVTYRFAGSGEWYYHIDSYLGSEKASANLQALLPTRLWSVSQQQMRELCLQHHDIALQFMQLQEHHLRYFNERCKYFQNRSLTDRYLELLARKPYLKDIPDKIIATYLNTCPQSISRLRREQV